MLKIADLKIKVVAFVRAHYIAIACAIVAVCIIVAIISSLPIDIHPWISQLELVWLCWMLLAFALFGPIFTKDLRGVAIGIIMGIIGVVVLLGAASLYIPSSTIEGVPYNISTHQPIQSLNTHYTYTGGGSFFLGTGSVSPNGEPRYFFYKPVEGGYFTLDSIPSAGVLWIEDENKNPNIETIVYMRRAGTKMFIPWIGVFKNWTEPAPEQTLGSKTIIHVPNGTVIQAFNPQVGS